MLIPCILMKLEKYELSLRRSHPSASARLFPFDHSSRILTCSSTMYPYWRDMRSRNRSLRRMSPVGLGFPLNRVQASTPTFVPSHPTLEFASLSYQHHQPQQQQPPVPLSRALTACSSSEPVTISSSRQMRRLRIRGADSKRQPRSRPAQAASPRDTCDDVQGRTMCQQPATHSAPATRNPEIGRAHV